MRARPAPAAPRHFACSGVRYAACSAVYDAVACAAPVVGWELPAATSPATAPGPPDAPVVAWDPPVSGYAPQPGETGVGSYAGGPPPFTVGTILRDTFARYGLADAAFAAGDHAKVLVLLDPLVDAVTKSADSQEKTNLQKNQQLSSSISGQLASLASGVRPS